MIYLILGTIIGAVWVAHSFDTIGEIILGLLLGALTGFLVGALMWISVGSIIGSFLPSEWKVVETHYLVALNDNSEIIGTFFLGCGTVDDENVYTYIVNTENGKQVRELKVENDDIYIKEYDEVPKIETKTLDFVNQNNYWFASPLWEDDIITFYIPEGSVTNSFNVDLK